MVTSLSCACSLAGSLWRWRRLNVVQGGKSALWYRCRRKWNLEDFAGGRVDEGLAEGPGDEEHQEADGDPEDQQGGRPVAEGHGGGRGPQDGVGQLARPGQNDENISEVVGCNYLVHMSPWWKVSQWANRQPM